MASALTAVQVEVLRRLRDGGDLFAEPPLPGVLGEVAFLLAIGLLDLHGPLDVQLSGLGRAYLAAIEAESAPAVAASDPAAGDLPPGA